MIYHSRLKKVRFSHFSELMKNAACMVGNSSAGVRESGGNAYLQVRARVELALREGSLPWVSARPSFITGPDRDEVRLGERIGAKVVDGLLGAAAPFGGSRLRARYRSTTNAALAEALVRLGFDEGRVNRVVESEELR